MMKILASVYILLSICVCLPVIASEKPSFKTAAVEFNPVFKQREQNFAAMEALVKQAAENQAKLILFPEMSTTGYLYGSRAEITPFADTIPGKTTAYFEDLATKYKVYIVVGMPEVDSATGMYYNAAFLVGPNGLIGKYRKNNLFLLESGWAAQGNLGIPVFDTELGKISIIICYDDYFYQSTRLASLKGANLLAFIASSGRMLEPDPEMAGVHISISDVQQQALQNGLFVVATNRTNIEKNDTLGIGVHYLGGASIWDPLGKNIAQAPVSTHKGQVSDNTETTILYGDINPSLYENSAKELLNHRRPELYGDITLKMSPRPMLASRQSHDVNALLVQYTPQINNIAANKSKIDTLLEENVSLVTNLIVFPEHSLTGPPPSVEKAKEFANTAVEVDAYFSALANRHDSYLVYSSINREGGKYYKSARILGPQGKIVGEYRKTHLNAEEKKWLTAGNDIPVFDTKIGRIGMLIGDEVLYPEAADVLSVKRADMIVVPVSWTGQYGIADELDKGFLVRKYPSNTNVIWYATAKNTQAYLMAANFVNTDQEFLGSSGLYSLDPTNGYYPPVVASRDHEEVLAVNFQTIAPETWWTSQQFIIDGRRPELYVPLVLDPAEKCFQNWQESSGYFVSCWR
ncbi:MAG: nitrilase-related carbon-nitrogen hydrolase [Sneathiella sp.]